MNIMQDYTEDEAIVTPESQEESQKHRKDDFMNLNM